MPRLHISNGQFYDEKGRIVHLRGINVDGSAKYPSDPNQPSHEPTGFLDGENVSFVNRPFPLAEAETHFSRLRRWGYTTIRWIFTWEALEHAGPGKVDQDFISYTVQCLRVAKKFQFMVIMDPHQDVWSRFSGGSGAPLWTLYACGLDPQYFPPTEAAIVQNTWPDPSQCPRMIWATNYYRMANQLMFTLFWAGSNFAPQAIINGQNIQTYLQTHYINAVVKLVEAIVEAGDLIDDVVIGWESLNEPNKGLIGHSDLAHCPEEQKLHKGTSPTAWQAILLASGYACEVETWDIGGMGPYKTGTTLVDPQGQSAWLKSDRYDKKYEWKRDPRWKLGQCLWEQCGVWSANTRELRLPFYFAKDPRDGEKIDCHYFTNHWFMDHFRAYRDAIRGVHRNAILFCQGPTLEIPPSLRGTNDQDDRIVFCPHWYDGLTLATKTWKWWNVDVFGLLRGRYRSPVFAIKIGETAIRNCFRDQMAAMRQEGIDQMGHIPTVFTETGIPFDMNDRKAYASGDYSSQVAALDAIHFALEGSGIQGYTLWNYTATNDHQWGDQWNDEDLSVFSKDDLEPDCILDTSRYPSLATDVSRASSRAIKETMTSETAALGSPTYSDHQSLSSKFAVEPSTVPDRFGYRAAGAHIRPWPRSVHGSLDSFGFDLRSCTFSLQLNADSSTAPQSPSEIFLPIWHFPQDRTHVEVSGGKWEIVVDHLDSTGSKSSIEESNASIQVLRWWHAEGEQSIVVKGLVRQKSAGQAETESASGYIEQCRAIGNSFGCSLM